LAFLSFDVFAARCDLLRMRNSIRRVPAARQSGGFTLVELLVVIGIIAILAGVALGPITKGITKARESAAMQTCRTIGLAEFQYANDNNGSYPYGTGPAIANALFSGNYISDPGVFILSGDAGAQKYTGAANGTFGTKNDSFDFMDVGTGASGLTSSTPDQCPVVWTPDTNIPAVPQGNAPAGVEFAPNNPLFGGDGIAIAYHSNNAFFRAPAGLQPPAGSYPDAKGQALFIDNSFNPNGVVYTKETGNSGY
jgi:prepilin-type N-terminal cleavage/methylation domain-containing protein